MDPRSSKSVTVSGDRREGVVRDVRNPQTDRKHVFLFDETQHIHRNNVENRWNAFLDPLLLGF